ncbi:MAG: DUF502 domain-containing protein [Acidobacteria bacterium]|nr:DUF502 domain-containing protein [Acidobacteriota bacterium]
MRLIQWLRRSFLAGFFIIVPLVISVFAIVWIIRVVDGVIRPLYAQLLGRAMEDVPVGLGLATTVLAFVLVGALAGNVIGRRLLQQIESALMRVPVFRTIYAPVKQIVVAFSPDNEYGFKRVVLVDIPGRGMVLGFLTKEFTIDRGHGPEPFMAVYVPTNHLYLGDVLIFPRDAVSYPDITVEQAIRIFLTGGMALEQRVHGRRALDRVRDFRV